MKITKDFEIILVNDASPDGAWDTIVQLAKKDSRVKGINLSRNFGQHHAITAGLDHCTGEWVVVMDCDLQDRPEEIFNLYKKVQEGFDYVYASRCNRRDNLIKRSFSKMFYKILGYLTGSKIDGSTSNFGIFNKNVINSVKLLREKIRWFPTLIDWVGFKGTAIEVDHSKRRKGKSSYSFRKLINLSLDVLILNSNKPLRLIIKLGFFISFISFCYAFFILISYFSGKIDVLGYSSLIISIWFIGGVIILILGVIGQYLSKTFDQVKERPIYIIKGDTYSDE